MIRWDMITNAMSLHTLNGRMIGLYNLFWVIRLERFDNIKMFICAKVCCSDVLKYVN